MNEAGDYVIAARGGSDRRTGTSGPSSARCSPAAHPGRTSDDEITVFESLGLAVEDLASAEYLMRRAAETGTGTNLEF